MDVILIHEDKIQNGNPQKHHTYLYGSSMRGVFAPGDLLTLCPVKVSELHAGDIVAVYFKSGDKPLCHRVIRVEDNTAVMQGDNKDNEDEHRITDSDDIYFVTEAVSFYGKKRVFHHGEAGMKDFFRHQRIRKIREAGRKTWLFLEPAMFWRIPLKEDGFCETSAALCWRNRIIASYGKESGVIRYRHPLLKLFFAPPRELTGKHTE